MPASKNSFKKIGVLSRKLNSKTQEIINNLCDFLKQNNINFLLEENIDKNNGTSREEIKKQCDLAIVVGGDGSILDAARSLAGSNIAVIGINSGNLGFLSSFSPHDYQQHLIEVLNGDFAQYEIFLLHADIYENNKIVSRNDAVNEVVLNSASITRMIGFELTINNKFVYKQRSDGLIIATPTGSTAYALSGGGPVIHPKLNALSLVPMFAHNLTSRPIVIEASSIIELKITNCGDLKAAVSCDGQPPILVGSDNKIIVQKSNKTLNLIYHKDYSYYKTLREKLDWNKGLDYVAESNN